MKITCGISTYFLCLALASSPRAMAHHSPSEVIESLTERIAQGERTAILFVRRADEQRAIGNTPSAVTDYEAALRLSTENLPALYGLAQAHFSQEHWNEAHVVAKRGLDATTATDEAAPFHAISARVHQQHGHWNLALDAWQQALASSRPNVDWFLGESQSYQRLNRANDARQALEAAMKRNPSAVLRRAWIAVLIDCNKIDSAEKQIAAGLARARWKSSWLLLRARLRLAQNLPDAAQQDARTALSEIARRQSPGSVNPFLTADRGLALHILGRHEEAKSDMELARAYGVLREKLAE